MQVATQTLEKYMQVISTDLMAALKESAEARGISVEMEVALRLTAYMSEPDLSSDNSLFNQIMQKEFSLIEATEECKHKREVALYTYEVEKLRLFLRFEQNLPRHIKEDFKVIDVKELAPIIKAEIKAEEKNED